MYWYLAKMVYRIVSENSSLKPQFDEQFRLIRADDVQWAWEKAVVIGRKEECAFLNTHNETVRWKFIAVEDVCQVDDIDDGVQLYAQTREPADVEEYISLVQSRAKRQLAFRFERSEENTMLPRTSFL